MRCCTGHRHEPHQRLVVPRDDHFLTLERLAHQRRELRLGFRDVEMNRLVRRVLHMVILYDQPSWLDWTRRSGCGDNASSLPTASPSSPLTACSPTTTSRTRRRAWRASSRRTAPISPRRAWPFSSRRASRYVVVSRGIWLAGGVAVPLAISHPPAELEYVVRDSGASIVVGSGRQADALEAIAAAKGARFIRTPDLLATDAAPMAVAPPAPDRRAMIVYTSGTTGKPKGAVTTHGNMAAQIASLDPGMGMDAGRLSRCWCCRCITCTASSTCSAARWPRAPAARCCRSSTPSRRGTGSRPARSRCSPPCRPSITG